MLIIPIHFFFCLFKKLHSDQNTDTFLFNICCEYVWMDIHIIVTWKIIFVFHTFFLVWIDRNFSVELELKKLNNEKDSSIRIINTGRHHEAIGPVQFESLQTLYINFNVRSIIYYRQKKNPSRMILHTFNHLKHEA